jgi:hypothetical protein
MLGSAAPPVDPPRWGPTTPATCRSWKARWSASRSITCPVTASPRRCGYGFSGIGVTAAEMDRLWQMFLRRFDLKAHLPVVEADPGLDPASSAHAAGGRPVELADRGRLHPTTTGPPTGSPMCLARGNDEPVTRAGSRRPGFVGDFATSARPWRCQPVFRKPSRPGPGHPIDSRNTPRPAVCQVGKVTRIGTAATTGKNQAG